MPRLHRAAWWLFIASAVLFGYSGVTSGDLAVIVGSAVFGAACVLFLIER
ncbi:MAG: hypothetical protein O2925_10610 [Actinomycetota bacterium]|jgi:hypothetical protein|nr:hypothetical protein [Actinomycetota bacterium]MDA3014645.1 hypothetical protein [Actinomycetota bacterium]MDA3029237.1 hypothetical protein [Actinomycetota bacterium]